MSGVVESPVAFQFLDGCDDLLHVLIGEQRFAMPADIARQAVSEDVAGHGGLQFRLADEEDNRVHAGSGQAQVFFEAAEMPIVLLQWVLEAERFFIELLRPLAVLLVAIDPAIHGLGFNDEEAVSRDDQVVDLCGAVGSGDDDVVELAVGSRREPEPQAQTGADFAKPASKMAHGGPDVAVS